MTKYEWDRRLRKALKELPADERTRVFEYYDELFEDRMDGGAKEEAIIAAFGEPEAAAKKILADYKAYLDREEEPLEASKEKKKAAEPSPSAAPSGRGFCTETDRGGIANKPDRTEIKAVEPEKSGNPPADEIFGEAPSGSETEKPVTDGRYGGIRKLKISVCASDVSVKRSDNCAVRTADDDESRFELTTSGDTLYIREKAASLWKNITLLFGGKKKEVSIELPQLESITFDAMKQSCEVEGFDLRRVTLKTVSGNLSVADCNSEYMSLSTTSGNIAVTGGRHDSVALSAASGDLKTARLSGKSLTAVSMSGDVEASGCSFDDRMLLKTVSGDVEADKVECANFECKTVSGNSNIRLVGDVKDYTVFVKSVSGNISAPRGGDGAKKAAVSTVGGTINLDINP